MTVELKTVDTERTYTSDEFENLPEFDERYELIDGRLVKKSVANYEHGWIARRLMLSVSFFDPKEKLGAMVFDTTFKIAPGFMPVPDLGYIIASRIVARIQKSYPGRPDIAVEVFSPHDLDSKNRQGEAREKIRKYQAAGVSIVWAINPDNKTIEVYHPDPNTPMQTFRLGDELTGEEVISGFKLKVSDLFE